MVISWILNAVSKEIEDSLFYLETAKAIWDDLHEDFIKSNAPRVFQIKQQLNNVSQGLVDVNTYFTHLKILWDELKNYQPVPICDCEEMKSWMIYQEQEYLMQFLMSLNDSFARN